MAASLRPSQRLSVRRPSSAVGDLGGGEEERAEYDNKCELMLSLVGYAVGLGNVWRFPSLVFENGGAAFLIPYLIALILLGLPLFVLEMGLGQMLRQGTLGVWEKLKLPRLRGLGMAATLCSWLVALYYNVIISWAIWYFAVTIGGAVNGLPWDDAVYNGGNCSLSSFYINNSIPVSSVFDGTTGRWDQSQVSNFWCPASGSLPVAGMECDPNKTFEDDEDGAKNKSYFEGGCADGNLYKYHEARPAECPARTALVFFQREALQQSKSLGEFGGIHLGQWGAYTVAWAFVYLCVMKGVESSGKVVYVTATLPYFVLFALLIRALTLENAGVGLKFFLVPDVSFLALTKTWERATTQIFYSLGPGFGSLIAFASYGKKDSNFVKDATIVSVINCSTSVLAGFVVFPVLAFLALELKDVDPCYFQAEGLDSVKSIISGPMLAFVAFPVAVLEMPLPGFWAVCFFIMLLCLGVDSMFAIMESVITVLSDAGVGKGWSKEFLSAVVCGISYLLGLVFVSRAGIYWVDFFDYYSCAIALFFVTFGECVGLVWMRPEVYREFLALVKENVGIDMETGVYRYFLFSWAYICPVLTFVFMCISFIGFDKLDAMNNDKYPIWTIPVGWMGALAPVITAIVVFFITPDVPLPRDRKSDQRVSQCLSQKAKDGVEKDEIELVENIH